jgi:excisionase family DNA binding protein
MTAKMFQGPQYMSVKDVAHEMGRSVKTIQRWIANKRIRAHKLGRDHLIDPKELHEDIALLDEKGERLQ